MTNTVKGLIVQPDGTETVTDVDTSLEGLQAIVGGHIEYVFVRPGVHAYVNEEGKMQGPPPNLKATRMCRLANHDVIAGTAVFLGVNPDDPAEEGDLPATWLDGHAE